MKFLISMDSFKGSCSAYRAGVAISKGILRAMPDAEIVNIPVADGGEGTVEAVASVRGGTLRACEVIDPLGRKRIAEYVVFEGGTAVIEMSASSGLTLLTRCELNPLIATTYGVGQMIVSALNDGCKKIVIGLGGSATNDGGAGMLQAMGVSLLDANGVELPFGGEALNRLDRIDITRFDTRILDCEVICAADVTNKLTGEFGATKIYGKQKGVTYETESVLESALENFGNVVMRDLGVDILNVKGGGAAGGLGAGLYAFLNAGFSSGIDMVLDIAGFDKAAKDADIVITGEGHMDTQTMNGKVPVGVARRAKELGDAPVIALVGGMDDIASEVYLHGLDGVYAIADGPIDFQESCRRVEPLLEKTAEAITRTIKAVMKHTRLKEAVL